MWPRKVSTYCRLIGKILPRSLHPGRICALGSGCLRFREQGFENTPKMQEEFLPLHMVWTLNIHSTRTHQSPQQTESIRLTAKQAGEAKTDKTRAKCFKLWAIGWKQQCKVLELARLHEPSVVFCYVFHLLFNMTGSSHVMNFHLKLSKRAFYHLSVPCLSCSAVDDKPDLL